jgi:hypothetical protein
MRRSSGENAMLSLKVYTNISDPKNLKILKVLKMYIPE